MVHFNRLHCVQSESHYLQVVPYRHYWPCLQFHKLVYHDTVGSISKLSVRSDFLKLLVLAQNFILCILFLVTGKPDLQVFVWSFLFFPCVEDISCYDGFVDCHNGRCVQTQYMCDGDNDCFDNTDEDPYYCSCEILLGFYFWKSSFRNFRKGPVQCLTFSAQYC